MTEVKKLIYICLRCLEFDFDSFTKSKQTRILFQKYCYLIEKIFGIGIGKFSLYINGPYNPKLANEGYNMVASREYYETEYRNSSIAKVPSGLFSRLRMLFQHQEISEVDFLELFTTYDYLRNANNTPDQAVEKLEKIKENIINNYSQLNIRELMINTERDIFRILQGT